LLRLCPLAMMSSCTKPIRPLRSVKNERPRYLDEARGQKGAGRLIRLNAAASFVSSRQYIRGRLGGSMLAADGLVELHGYRRCNQARTLRLSADILPLLRSETSSKPTF
jgi:hypothetical protein